MTRVQKKQIQIDYQPRSQFLPYHHRKQRFACLIAHRRSGKTVATINDLIMRAAQTPNGRFAFIAPYRAQAKDVAFEYLKFYAAPLLADAPSESELKVDLVNGARVRLYGSDNPDSLRGLGFDSIVCDEMADFRAGVWSEILRPALAMGGHPGASPGSATFIGTPRGKGELFELFQIAQKSDAWFSLELKASDTGLIPQEELDEARKAMSKEQYEQEFECSFDAALIGSFYADELERMKKEGRITKLPIDRAVPCHVSFDLGISDSTAIWVCQPVGKERRLILYHEASGVGLQYYAQWLKDQGLTYSHYYFPHDVSVRELGTGQSRVDTLIGLGIDPTIIPQHAVLDGVNSTRRFLDSCWIDPERCERGLEALKQYRREWDDKLKAFKQRARHGWESHGADSLRYMATGFEEKKPASKQTRRRWMPRMSRDWMSA